MKRRIRRWHCVLIVVAVMALLACWFLYPLLTAKPGSMRPRAMMIGPLQLSAQGATETDVDSDRNGWHEFARALEAADAITRQKWSEFDDPPTDTESKYAFPIDFGAVGQPDAPADVLEFSLAVIRAQDQAGIPEMLDAALAKPFFVRRFDVPAGADDFILLGTLASPGLTQARAMLRAEMARMRLALAVGDASEAERIVSRQIGMARALSLQPLVIDRLIGVSVADRLDRELRSAVRSQTFTPEALRRMADALGSKLLTIPGSLHIECERLATLCTVDYCYTDNGKGDGNVVLSRMLMIEEVLSGNSGSLLDNAAGTTAEPLAAIFYPSKRQTVAVVDGIFDGCVLYSETPADRRGTSVPSPDVLYTGLPPKHRLPRAILPSLGSFIVCVESANTDIAATRALLLVEAIRLETGAPPESLDVLGEAAIDPMTGKPFGYILMPQDKTGGRGYILYAFGRDLTDNNGAPGRQVEVLRSNRATGLDWVISEPEPEVEPAAPTE